jgi:hypothetical protein
MKKKLSLLLLSSILFFSNAQSSPLSAGGGGSIQSILNMQIGNVVTIKLQSGNELIGIVDSVNAQVVHLSKIAGKEYFDAAASINSIEALLVKTKK